MSKKKEHPAPPVEPVHLTRKWNLEPPVYLTIIWVAAIIAVLYVTAVLPGQIKSGRYYTFSSPVQGSAVYLDGEYLGSGTVTEFVSSGSHTLRFDFRDIAGYEMPLEVRPAVLFTHLFPKKHEVQSPFFLDSSQMQAYLEQLFSDVISHSTILSYDEVYHYPPLFTYAAQTAVSGGMEALALPFFRDSALFVTSEQMRDDYLSALDLLAQHGAPGSEFDLIRDKLTALSYDISPRSSSPPEAVSVPAGMNILSFADIGIRGYTFSEGSAALGRTLSEWTYPGVQEGSAEAVIPSPFTISEGEVSEYLYARFLEERPFWAKGNKDELISQQLVDDSYLDGVYPSTAFESMTPVRNISYRAAQAFTEWLSEATGRDVRLPSQAEWEAAGSGENSYARTLTAYRSGVRPAGMLGGVWEMTRSPYIPLERYLEYSIELNENEVMMILKGGSYLNDEQSVDTASVGLIAQDECSDTAGFRIVWY